MNINLDVGRLKEILSPYPKDALISFSLPEKYDNVHNIDSDYLATFSGE